MTKTISVVGSVLLALSLVATAILFNPPQAGAQTLVAVEDLSAGDLIRGVSLSGVYYYGEDGFRYVFPNDKVFFSWYDNFDSVKWVSDSDLASVQIGGNVTYKPGVRMIKINTDPKTYAVGAGGTLHWVTSEEIAIALYGPQWNKMISDVGDAFFANYERGSDILSLSGFNPTAEENEATSISANKNLEAATVITITPNGFSPAQVDIDAGTAIRFVNESGEKNTASAMEGGWGSGTLNDGQNFSRYFNESGIYHFESRYNDAFAGTIVVN